LVCVLLAAPTLSFAASREIQELQRDVSLLQQQIRDLQRAQDEKFSALTELARQAIDAGNKASTGVAVIQSSLTQSLRDQEAKVVTPVVNLGVRMDNMSNDMHTLQQAVSDLASVMSRMQAQLTDLSNAVKLIGAPPTAPPQPLGSNPGGSAEAPPMPATDLYNHAMADKTSGKLDLASQEFADYLKYYGNTELAPNAQFYIGTIHFGQGNYEAAVRDFDMVLEKYQDNPKTADARLYKGRSLVRMQGHRTEGADEFKELIKRYPGTDQARQACSELTSLGLRCAPPVAGAKGASKRSAGR